MVCLHSYIKQYVSNSQLFVFYSTKSLLTLQGNATNWNDTGFDENYEQLSKFNVKLLQC
jgi:hypothetical protein